VTTLSCVLGAVWPLDRALVLAERDPAGGDLAGRFGLSTRIGMTSLILTQRQGIERQRGGGGLGYQAHVQRLPGGMEVLVAPIGADSAMALDHEIATADSDGIPADCDLIADCGRLLPGAGGQERTIRLSDRVVLVVRPDLAGLSHARWAAERIRDLAPSVAVTGVVVGSGDFPSSAIVDALGIDVLEHVPFDARGARIACGAPGTAREFVRSALVASARRMVTHLFDPPAASTANENTRQGRWREQQHAEVGRRLLNKLHPAPVDHRRRRHERTGRARAASE
jgi:hypothetical protein